MGLAGTCFVEIFVPSVAVYPSFDPAVEVRNAQEFIESFSQDIGAGIIMLNLSGIGALVYFWRRYASKAGLTLRKRINNQDHVVNS